MEVADGTVTESKDVILLIIAAPPVGIHRDAARMFLTESNNTSDYAFFEVFNVRCRDDQSFLQFQKLVDCFLQVITAGI
ncbi:MAG: hypothetical protein V4594_16810 [Bacteroidota bacterium]